MCSSRFSASTTDTAFQSMRSRLMSVYKFSKPGKVKQLRLGNWREKSSVEDTMMMLNLFEPENFETDFL